MELTLEQQTETQVSVTCDGQASHTFDLQPLLLNSEKNEQALLDDPIAYGRKLYTALFPLHTLAQHALAAKPKRLLLVAIGNHLDAVPWEYMYGAYGANDPSNSAGFLVLECHVVRGLPANQTIESPKLDTGLHIIAVPSNPLSSEIEPLNIEGEWIRLREVMQDIPYAITLERVRPPTLERVRQLVANQKGRVVHFMGHGGQSEEGALLCFEQENGDLERVTAKELVKRLRGTAFVVTLNACVSAKPGSTPFSNLAAALVRQKTPYALGMRLSIVDEDARTFSRNFYSELARGSPVEDALFQARLTLAHSSRRWVIGVPVLYTALTAPTAGFACIAGKPTIKEYQPPVESSALPRAEGTFQGRIEELKQLGTYLAGDNRPPLVTIHGGGGQGKTALAREAIERFAYAWPGGIWAISLEDLPDQWRFAADLAQFLGLDIGIIREHLVKTVSNASIHEIEEEVQRQLERLVLARLAERRTLLVLDNAETLIERAKNKDPAALELGQFIRQKLPGRNVSLLVTSRDHLGWAGEQLLELGGLSPAEGARLFRQSAPSRQVDAGGPLAQKLSEKVEGQPLSLRLLGGAFDSSKLALAQFLKDYEQVLVEAEDKYTELDYRQRTLFASIETSVRSLDDKQRSLLSGLWIFHAPFLAETAAAVFKPATQGTEQTSSSVDDRLSALWRRGLLTFHTVTVRDGTMQLYHLLPTTRPYVEHYLEQSYDVEGLQRRFGAAYSRIAAFVYRELNQSAAAVAFAQQSREDLERGWKWVTGVEQGYYLLWWGSIVHRWGSPLHGLELLERALEMAQGVDRDLELQVLNNTANAYHETGHSQEALQLYEQALALARRVENRDREALILATMAEVYRITGQPLEAIKLCQQALAIAQEVEDKQVQAIALNNMGLAYNAMGQPQEGFKFFEQALPLERDVKSRRGEAFVLNNIAYVYNITEQPQEALSLYKRALLLYQEIGDRRAEALVLSNMATIYHKRGQLQEAAKLVEQALAIQQAAGDHETAVGLNSLACLYEEMQNYPEALKTYEQSVAVAQQVDYPAAAVGALVNMAFLLYSKFKDSDRAIVHMEQAITI